MERKPNFSPLLKQSSGLMRAPTTAILGVQEVRASCFLECISACLPSVPRWEGHGAWLAPPGPGEVRQAPHPAPQSVEHRTKTQPYCLLGVLSGCFLCTPLCLCCGGRQEQIKKVLAYEDLTVCLGEKISSNSGSYFPLGACNSSRHCQDHVAPYHGCCLTMKRQLRGLKSPQWWWSRALPQGSKAPLCQSSSWRGGRTAPRGGEERAYYSFCRPKCICFEQF